MRNVFAKHQIAIAKKTLSYSDFKKQEKYLPSLALK